jgi:hypothetical protein
MKSKNLQYAIAGFIGFCCLCLSIGLLGSALVSRPKLLPTPILQSNISTIVFQTASVAQTQTVLAMPPTSFPTVTLAPTFEPIPTSTIFIFSLQTDVAQPTQPPQSTQPIQATQPPQSAVCSCDGGLDCKDFSTHARAQACYDYCKSLGHGDVHGLDGNDQDGLACESLP